jgi:phosphatidylglycerol---prolipoprotein diacylglyceryl transferase
MSAAMMFAVLPFPDIDPVLFQIGPFAVRWYALAYIAGLLFASWYMKRLVTNPSSGAG